MAALGDDFPSENEFGDVLSTFCFYDYGVNSSDAVEKIYTDQKDYRKSYLGVIIIPPSINASILIKKVGY